jgi:hypothetical protein
MIRRFDASDDLTTRSRVKLSTQYSYNLGSTIINSPVKIPTLEWAAEHVNNTTNDQQPYEPHRGLDTSDVDALSHTLGAPSVTGVRQKIISPF